MNSVRERILIGVKRYSDFGLHKDLISFCVGSECFEDWEEVTKNGGEYVADFCELIVIVEKDWLFELMKKEEIKDPHDYLLNEYTSDESYEWFSQAKESGKLVMVSFG